MEWKLELIVVPVSDVDRAKAFYTEQTGFTLDVDHREGDFRVVQLTPSGSACSIALMHNTDAPGSLQGLHLVVAGGQTPGPHPERSDYGTFFSLNDPDGNGWLVQEVKR